jgi:phosphatidylglycerol:prolipoprotein diacylglycerol transferase
MYPAINIGPLVFPTAGLIYILGAWISLSLSDRSARRLQLKPEPVYGVAATALFSGIAGARLTFVALYWSAFRENLLAIIWPLNSGYNLPGGLIVAILAAVYYGRARRLSPGPTLDALAPAIVLGLMFVSAADFLAGPGFGTLARVPWAITQFSVRRHPVQIYEIIVAILALALWYRFSKERLERGHLFLLSTAVYSGGRLFVDAFRENAFLTSNGLHLVQIICLIVMLTSLYLLGRSVEPAAG